MGRVTTRVPVRKIRYAEATLPRPRADVVAVEEPLEVRAGGRVLTVTMRTPGADIDLVHGWLLAEGLIRTGRSALKCRNRSGGLCLNGFTPICRRAQSCPPSCPVMTRWPLSGS